MPTFDMVLPWSVPEPIWSKKPEKHEARDEVTCSFTSRLRRMAEHSGKGKKHSELTTGLEAQETGDLKTEELGTVVGSVSQLLRARRLRRRANGARGMECTEIAPQQKQHLDSCEQDRIEAVNAETTTGPATQAQSAIQVAHKRTRRWKRFGRAGNICNKSGLVTSPPVASDAPLLPQDVASTADYFLIVQDKPSASDNIPVWLDGIPATTPVEKCNLPVWLGGAAEQDLVEPRPHVAADATAVAMVAAANVVAQIVTPECPGITPGHPSNTQQVHKLCGQQAVPEDTGMSQGHSKSASLAQKVCHQPECSTSQGRPRSARQAYKVLHQQASMRPERPKSAPGMRRISRGGAQGNSMASLEAAKVEPLPPTSLNHNICVKEESSPAPVARDQPESQGLPGLRATSASCGRKVNRTRDKMKIDSDPHSLPMTSSTQKYSDACQNICADHVANECPLHSNPDERATSSAKVGDAVASQATAGVLPETTSDVGLDTSQQQQGNPPSDMVPQIIVKGKAEKTSAGGFGGTEGVAALDAVSQITVELKVKKTFDEELDIAKEPKVMREQNMVSKITENSSDMGLDTVQWPDTSEERHVVLQMAITERSEKKSHDGSETTHKLQEAEMHDMQMRDVELQAVQEQEGAQKNRRAPQNIDTELEAPDIELHMGSGKDSVNAKSSSADTSTSAELKQSMGREEALQQTSTEMKPEADAMIKITTGRTKEENSKLDAGMNLEPKAAEDRVTAKPKSDLALCPAAAKLLAAMQRLQDKEAARKAKISAEDKPEPRTVTEEKQILDFPAVTRGAPVERVSNEEKTELHGGSGERNLQLAPEKIQREAEPNIDDMWNAIMRARYSV